MVGFLFLWYILGMDTYEHMVEAIRQIESNKPQPKLYLGDDLLRNGISDQEADSKRTSPHIP